MTVEGIYNGVKAGIPADVHDDIQAFFLVRQRRAFRTSGRSERSKWAGFGREPKYRSFKQKLTGDLSPLTWKREGRLFNSLTRSNDADQTFRVTGDTIRFGSRVPYAHRLYTGGVGPFGERYPGRNFLHLSDRSMNVLANLILRTLAGDRPPAAAWRNPR